MKAAVITPYYKEDVSILRRCHLSVLDQEFQCRHFMVADGFPNEIVSSWDCEHIILSKPHGDSGNTPRAIGALSAMNHGFQLICFLDADNWYCRNHVSEAVRIKQEKPNTDVVALQRNIILPDGTPVPDSLEDRNQNHIDTSCYAFFESAFSVLPLWAMMPPFLGAIGDRIVFLGIQKRQLHISWSSQKTCYYTSNYKSSYLAVDRTPPPHTNDPNWSDIGQLLHEQRELVFARTGIRMFIQSSR